MFDVTKRCWIAFLAVAFSTPGHAAEFGESRQDKVQMVTAFGALAEMCARDFGFTRVASKSTDTLVDKLEAHLLLAADKRGLVRQWAAILNDARAMDRAAEDDELADRLADFLIAAMKDPDSYARAERMWIETFKAPAMKVVGGCRTAVSDPFIGVHFLAGQGSADRYDAKLKSGFAEQVRSLGAE